jgi:putative salt-induced outer membrane protein YdiY
LYKTTLKFLVIITFLCVAWPVWAEDEPDKSWNNKTTLGLVNTSGNSEISNFAFANLFDQNWDRSRLEVEFSALRNETTTRVLSNPAGTAIETSTTELSAEKYAFGTKYIRTIHEKFDWYATLGWYRDEFAGIKNSYQGGGGLGYVFFQSDKHTLKGEAGIAYVQQDYVDGADQSFPEVRLFSGYARKLSESSKLDASLELLENLDDTSDIRINALIGATANLNKRVALSVSYEIRYDAVPVTVIVPGDPAALPPIPDALFEFDEIDTTLKAALVLNF